MCHPFIQLAKDAGCTTKQIDVLRLAIERHSMGYIGQALGFTRQMAQQHYEAGVARLRKHCKEQDINADTLRYWGLDTDRHIELAGKDPYDYDDGLVVPGMGDPLDATY